jgi:hypothetical protein
MRRSEDSAMRVWDLEPRDAVMLAAILMATALINLPEHPRRLDVRLQAPNREPPALHNWTGVGKSFIYDSWWFRNPATLPQSSYYRPLQAAWFGLSYRCREIIPSPGTSKKIALGLQSKCFGRIRIQIATIDNFAS